MLRDSLVRQGNWLFRWRSYLPVPLLVGLIIWVAFAPDTLAAAMGATAWQALCLAVGAAGLAIRVWVAGQVPKGTSGRNTKVGQVADTLNSTGPYSLLRHPLYVGNFLMWMAVALFTRTPWAILLAAAFFWFVYERIMLAEEDFLRGKFGDRVQAWADRTPAVIPAFPHWRPADLPFSWKTALRREYSGMFGLVAALAVMEVVRELNIAGTVWLTPLWRVVLPTAAFLYILLRTLKRRTRLLSVEGR